MTEPKPSVVLYIHVRNKATVRHLPTQLCADMIMGRFCYFVSPTLPVQVITCDARLWRYTLTIAPSARGIKVEQPNGYTVPVTLQCNGSNIELAIRRLPHTASQDSLLQAAKACYVAMHQALNSMRLKTQQHAYSSTPVIPFNVRGAYAPLCLMVPENPGVIPPLLYADPTMSPYTMRDALEARTYYAMEHLATGTTMYNSHVGGVTDPGAPRALTSLESFGLDPAIVYDTVVDDVSPTHAMRCAAACVPVRPARWRDALEARLVEELR